MLIRHIVCLLFCVAKFNAQDLLGGLVDGVVGVVDGAVGVVDGTVDGVVGIVDDLLPEPTKAYISRGYDAYPGQFPYQALLKTNGRFFCGASLIGQRWVWKLIFLLSS